MEPVKALANGKLTVISAKHGAMVEKNEIIGFIA
jgi:biotin carboxyl carrier protein